MKRSVAFSALWGGLIAILLSLEVAELTHFFTLPIQTVVGDPVALFTALVFITVLAAVGAIFIGLYISQRLLAPRGFTPFEQEMLRMRREVQEVRSIVEEMRRSRPPGPTRPVAEARPKERP
jgi:hypothetical protein